MSSMKHGLLLSTILLLSLSSACDYAPPRPQAFVDPCESIRDYKTKHNCYTTWLANNAPPQRRGNDNVYVIHNKGISTYMPARSREGNTYFQLD